MKTTPLVIAAAAAALATPVMATAASQVLFSQSASAVSASAVRGSSATLTLRTGHAPVMAFEERPGRRTGTLGEQHFIGLWKTTFADDAPNALLTGVDTQGRSRRVVVEVTGAARTATGVRYRVRALRGSLPASLTKANLMIDSVSLASVSAALQAYLDGNGNRVQAYEPIINAMYFPAAVQPQVAQSLVVTPGNPFTIATPRVPQTLIFGSLTMYPGTQVIMPSAGVVSLTFATPGMPCDVPAGLVFSVTVTGSDGSVVSYPGTSLPGVTQQTYAAGASMCTVVWDIPVPKPIKKNGVVVVVFSTTTTLTNGADSPVVLQQARMGVD